jgi:alpha-galactosidase
MKITVVGAGSRSFGPGTIRDVLLSDALNAKPIDFALMDIVEEHLKRPECYGRQVAERLGRSANFTCTTDLDRAVEGADFVVTAVEVDRYLHWAQDFHVPRKYGFMQVFGENGGPGGMFHALRNMGPMVQIARRMEELCPDALLLNFTNPEHKLCEAVTRLTKIQAIGLCHGFVMGRDCASEFLGIPVEELDTAACGLNHFTWMQKIRHAKTGADLYPKMKEKERQADPLANWEHLAMCRVCMKVYGLWPSLGTNHIGEYIRWAEEFLASSRLQYYYDPLDGEPKDTGRIPRFVYSLGGRPTEAPLFPEKKPEAALPDFEKLPDDAELKPSGELAVPIMEALACGRRHHLHAVNVPNRGSIPGIDDATVVEVPATADAGGVKPLRMEPLPAAVTAMVRTQATIHQLLTEAFAENSRMKLLQALLLDPTVHSYRSAVNLVNEMFELQKDILPPMEW